MTSPVVRTSPSHAPRHPWAIVAPWWKWPLPTTSATGRMTRPEIQKYETSRLVDEFIKNPQRHLKWMDEDLVHIVVPAPQYTPNTGKPRRFSDLAYEIDPRRTRKIFLDSHKRFYLVVCQLHCDAPGFPRADRADVCSAGFVVRRRTTDVPPDGAKQAGAIVASINKARRKLGELDTQAGPASGPGPGSGEASAAAAVPHGGASFASSALMIDASATPIARQRASTRALLDLERSRLREWSATFDVTVRLQGWYPAPGLENIGAWVDVAEKPALRGAETVYPLYPLIPARNDEAHAGRFGTLYYGLLPTGSGDTDSQGHARFDDQQYYEVTCFAERHLTPHDRGSACRCPDKVFWSLPSLPYRLASQFDVVGTSRRPVTVQMPDIDALAAQAAPRFGVAFAKPAGSLMFTADGTGKIDGIKKTGTGPDGRSKLPEICSFSIPLITIVASFLFELFLPIVMIAFQLWFMLKLKFCILPEISVAAGVTAELSLNTTAVEELLLKTNVDLSIEAAFGAGAPHESKPIADALKLNFSPIATANMELAVVGAAKGTGPDLTDGLVFETEVAHP